MINATELRIGNYIRYGEDIQPVVGINKMYVQIKSNYSIEVESLHPIPMDEEWLFQMGFEKSAKYMEEDERVEYAYMKIYSPFNVENTENPDYEITIVVGKATGYPIRVGLDQDGENIALGEISYVHQLQNLYFALSGQELTIV